MACSFARRSGSSGTISISRNARRWSTKASSKSMLATTKAEASKRLVPLHACQLEDLNAWREVAPYPDNDSWVFASHRTKGRKPYWPDAILGRQIRPLAKRLGINKRSNWHTFRRTFSSLLTANREDIKVVQELTRHANPNPLCFSTLRRAPKTCGAHRARSWKWYAGTHSGKARPRAAASSGRYCDLL